MLAGQAQQRLVEGEHPGGRRVERAPAPAVDAPLVAGGGDPGRGDVERDPPRRGGAQRGVGVGRAGERGGADSGERQEHAEVVLHRAVDPQRGDARVVGQPGELLDEPVEADIEREPLGEQGAGREVEHEREQRGQVVGARERVVLDLQRADLGRGDGEREAVVGGGLDDDGGVHVGAGAEDAGVAVFDLGVEVDPERGQGDVEAELGHAAVVGHGDEAHEREVGGVEARVDGDHHRARAAGEAVEAGQEEPQRGGVDALAGQIGDLVGVDRETQEPRAPQGPQRAVEGGGGHGEAELVDHAEVVVSGEHRARADLQQRGAVGGRHAGVVDRVEADVEGEPDAVAAGAGGAQREPLGRGRGEELQAVGVAGDGQERREQLGSDGAFDRDGLVGEVGDEVVDRGLDDRGQERVELLGEEVVERLDDVGAEVGGAAGELAFEGGDAVAALGQLGVEAEADVEVVDPGGLDGDAEAEAADVVDHGEEVDDERGDEEVLAGAAAVGAVLDGAGAVAADADPDLAVFDAEAGVVDREADAGRVVDEVEGDVGGAEVEGDPERAQADAEGVVAVFDGRQVEADPAVGVDVEEQPGEALALGDEELGASGGEHDVRAAADGVEVTAGEGRRLEAGAAGEAEVDAAVAAEDAEAGEQPEAGGVRGPRRLHVATRLRPCSLAR
ncbi:MAG: hypothetical protein H6701_06575 [Myxococcales bacterium]|nr:hypothetical protein [Myxococcales bacterium]